MTAVPRVCVRRLPSLKSPPKVLLADASTQTPQAVYCAIGPKSGCLGPYIAPYYSKTTQLYSKKCLQVRVDLMMPTIKVMIKVGMGGATSKPTCLRNHAFRSPVIPMETRPRPTLVVSLSLAPRSHSHHARAK